MITKIIIIAALLTLPSLAQSFDDTQKIIEVNTKERNLSLSANKICPVEGIEINSTVPLLVYENKIIGFCCQDCTEAFLKNHSNYEEKLERSII